MSRETIARLREEAHARIESDPQGALSRFQHLLKFDPNDIDGWANFASLQMRLGQTDAAAHGYGRVLHLAQLADSAEWASYAQRSLAHLRQSAPSPHADGSASGAAQTASVRKIQPRPRAPDASEDDPSADIAASETGKPSGVAVAIARASLALVAGLGLLLLIATGAVSQLWPYPFVRAALLQSIDNLLAGTLLCYLGSILLLNAWSRYRIGQIGIYLVAGAFLSLAAWLTLSGVAQLSGFFAECTNVEQVKKACNVQIEEFEKMTPEMRKKLNVLGL